MKHTLVAKVQDQPGVLNRVASLFRRRAFNIDSLTVGHTEDKEYSRMTIVVDTARVPAPIVAANLRKLIPVAEVVDVTHLPTVDRDLALIRVRSKPARARRAREPGRHLPGAHRGRGGGVGDRRGHRGRAEGRRARGAAAPARHPRDDPYGQGGDDRGSLAEAKEDAPAAVPAA